MILFSSDLDKKSLIGKFICNNFLFIWEKLAIQYIIHLCILVSDSGLRFIFEVDTYTEMQTGDIVKLRRILIINYSNNLLHPYYFNISNEL